MISPVIQLVLLLLRRMDEKSKTPFGAYLILIVFAHRHLSESGKTVSLRGHRLMEGTCVNIFTFLLKLIKSLIFLGSRN
jgi:hypothetical protein